jgi:phosphohistidine phosphatase
VTGLVRALPLTVPTVALIGHEPTMSGVTLALAGPGSDGDALAAVSTKFPTNAIAVLRFTGDWPALGPGTARLESFVKPRA